MDISNTQVPSSPEPSSLAELYKDLSQGPKNVASYFILNTRVIRYRKPRESLDTCMVLWVGPDEKSQLYKIVGYPTSLAYPFMLPVIPDQWYRFEGTQRRDSKVFILNNTTFANR